MPFKLFSRTGKRNIRFRLATSGDQPPGRKYYLGTTITSFPDRFGQVVLPSESIQRVILARLMMLR